MFFLHAGKLFTAIANPLFIAIAVLAFSAFSQRHRARSPLFLLSLFAAILLFVCSSGCGSRMLLQSLEGPYVSSTIARAPVAQAIVVLGGYLRAGNRTGREVEIGAATDRLLCAAELYRASKARWILLTGGNGPFFGVSATAPEAVLAGRILQEWGIPPSAILTERQSLSTHDNAVFSGRILREKGIDRVLLVTSGYHMRRAEATFRNTGLTVYPFAADFMAQGESSYSLLSLMPDAQSLVNSGLAIKEWLGIGVYRFRNWL